MSQDDERRSADSAGPPGRESPTPAETRSDPAEDRPARPRASRWHGGNPQAIIAAAAALAGAGLGGIGAYWSARYGQDRQDARAEQEATAVARGTGRVLQRQFITSDTILRVMLQQRRYARFEEIVPTFPFEDRKALAARLSAPQWDSVADADATLRSLLPLLQTPRPPGTPLSPDDRRSLTGTLKVVDQAIRALTPLTGISP